MSVHRFHFTQLTMIANTIGKVDKVYTKPYRLFTYIFATMVVLVGGVQANALTFGREIILAGADATTPVNTNLQKLFAVLIVTFVCQLQAYSRTIYIRVSNVLAIFKISSLVFISICGLIALGGIRRHSIALIDTSYGTENLTHVFDTRAESPYAYSLALLNVMRAFLGYENANLVDYTMWLIVCLADQYRRSWKKSEGQTTTQDVSSEEQSLSV